MLTWKKQKKISLLFASNFSLPTKAKLIVRIFALFRLQKLFVSLPIFSFRFKAKRNKRFFASFHHTRCRHKKVKDQPSYFSSIPYKLSQNFTLSFFALFEVFASFSFCFRFISFFASKRKKFASIPLRSENDGSFLLPFRFISLRSENDGSFLLLFRFVFASFHFRFSTDFYVSHRCETSEKSTFFRIEANKISLPFRFISLWSEMTAHPIHVS